MGGTEHTNDSDNDSLVAFNQCSSSEQLSKLLDDFSTVALKQRDEEMQSNTSRSEMEASKIAVEPLKISAKDTKADSAVDLIAKQAELGKKLQAINSSSSVDKRLASPDYSVSRMPAIIAITATLSAIAGASTAAGIMQDKSGNQESMNAESFVSINTSSKAERSSICKCDDQSDGDESTEPSRDVSQLSKAIFWGCVSLKNSQPHYFKRGRC